MKKIITILCAVVMALSLFAGCGQKADDNNTAAAGGTVATDGSTSMEKVIGALGESFMEANSGTTFTYNPTGSGSGIQAVSKGRCDIGLSIVKHAAQYHHGRIELESTPGTGTTIRAVFPNA